MSARRRISGRRVERWLQNELESSALLRVHNSCREGLLWHGHRLFESGRLAEAERVFVLVEQLWPRDATLARLGQGACRQSAGDLPAAIQLYSQVIEEAPGDPFSLANRAECYLLMGDRTAACGDLRQAGGQLTSRLAPLPLADRIERLRALAEGTVNRQFQASSGIPEQPRGS